MSKITYDDKVDLQVATNIANINKVTASDMNEIKNVVNGNVDEVGDITSLTTTDKTSVVNAINELETDKLETSAVVNEPSTETDKTYSTNYLNDKLVSVGTTAPTDSRRVWFEKGKNLFDKNAQPYKNNRYIDGSGQEGSTQEFSIFRTDLEPNTTYTLTNSGSSGTPGYALYNASGTRVGGSNYSNRSHITFTTTSDTSYMLESVVTDTSSTKYDLDIFQIEKGSTATSYEPYINPTINVDGNEIYNLKLQTPQKIILSFNTTYVYSTDLDYSCFRLGNLVFLFINTIAFKVGTVTDFPNYAVFISGLPNPTQNKLFYLQPSGNSDNKFRAGIATQGNVQRHWSSDPAYGNSQNKQYSGFIVYEAKD